MAFRSNTPDVTHELVDGEVIIVHVVTGAYYSLNGSAAAIWGWLDRGADIASIAKRVSELNGGNDEGVTDELQRFTSDLEKEGLISPAPSAAGSDALLDDSPAEGIAPFIAPKFEKYSDMEELLLVDPIHEVSPQGWPEKPPGLP